VAGTVLVSNQGDTNDFLDSSSGHSTLRSATTWLFLTLLILGSYCIELISIAIPLFLRRVAYIAFKLSFEVLLFLIDNHFNVLFFKNKEFIIILTPWSARPLSSKFKLSRLVFKFRALATADAPSAVTLFLLRSRLLSLISCFLSVLDI